MRLLLVEDDAELAAALADGFADHGVTVAREASVPTGLARLARDAFDVVVLDVMLPGGSGFDLCRALRRRDALTPVLMLTARDAVDDRVRGLEAGADDYLVKPFAFRELLARVRALVRRRAAPAGGTELPAPRVVRVADLEVDLLAHTARRAGRAVPLTAKEFALLELLVRHAGAVVDRAAITAHVWDANHDPFTNVLEVLVRRLRRKIDDGFAPKLIHTLRGAGYRFGP